MLHVHGYGHEMEGRRRGSPQGSFRRLSEASKRLPEASQKLPKASGSFPEASESFRKLPGGFRKLPKASLRLPEASQRLPEAHQEKVLHVDMGFFPNIMFGKKSHVDMRFSHVNMGFFSEHDVGTLSHTRTALIFGFCSRQTLDHLVLGVLLSLRHLLRPQTSSSP
jgi:hypothetical protein